MYDLIYYSPKDIYKFARDGNVEKLTIALNYNNNTTYWYQDFNGVTALHLASREGRIRCVKLLLKKGIDIEGRTNIGSTALHLAAYNGHRHVVAVLLDRGAEIDSKNTLGSTALHLAANNNHINVANLLLNRGASIDSMTYGGITALHRAANFGKGQILNLLLKRGAMIESNLDAYAPFEGEDDDEEREDCRPSIVAEIEHRQRRAIFDSFITYHIEYQPYINDIYSICYPSGDTRIAEPTIGWARAEEVRNKFYFDEVFFYLHLHIAMVLTKKGPKNKIITRLSSKKCTSITQLARNNDDTSTLMTVLQDRLKLYLKPV